MRFTPFRFVVAATLASTALHLSSQRVFAQADQSRIEQSQRFRTSVQPSDEAHNQSEIVGEPAPDSPGDNDLGEQVILKRQEKPNPFTVFGEVSGFDTTNAALTKHNEKNDGFLFSQVGFSYQPRINRDLSADFTIRQAVFRYATFSQLDFESLNIGTGLTYVDESLWNVAFSARYNFNLLTDAVSYKDFFEDHTLTLGALKTFSLSKAHFLYAGFSGVLGWSIPSASERDEVGPYFGYHSALTRNLTLDLFYRIAWFHYNFGNREDLNQTLAAALQYNFTPWLSINASLSSGFNNSNHSQLDYTTLNSGGGLSVSYKF